ncbi:MAG: FkbM family methyltransferase [Desulfobacterales bacterium]|nr:FkbM family methyltransferase [Desulfobacterales bacterium]
MKKKAADFIMQLFKKSIEIFGQNKATAIMAQISEDIAPILAEKTQIGTIRFFCPGKLPEWRAKTLLTKEPETIEWINTFNKEDIFWDIGANVGVYSLYAALRGLSVLSFEPSPSNYYLLSKNIEINKMDDKISAYCLALSDITKLDLMYMTDTRLGGALNSFGETRDWQGKTYEASLKQAMLGFSIDDFIGRFKPSFPNHIKIDVDGIEDSIIIGSLKTIKDKRLKSILVELDTGRSEYVKKITDHIFEAGLSLHKKEHSATLNGGRFSNVYNHIFIRS